MAQPYYGHQMPQLQVVGKHCSMAGAYVLQQLLYAGVHDLLRQQLLHEQEADEAYVAQAALSGLRSHSMVSCQVWHQVTCTLAGSVADPQHQLCGDLR